MLLNTHIMPYLLNIEDYIKIVENYEFEERYPGYIVTKEPVGLSLPLLHGTTHLVRLLKVNSSLISRKYYGLKA